MHYPQEIYPEVCRLEAIIDCHCAAQAETGRVRAPCFTDFLVTALPLSNDLFSSWIQNQETKFRDMRC